MKDLSRVREAAAEARSNLAASIEFAPAPSVEPAGAWGMQNAPP